MGLWGKPGRLGMSSQNRSLRTWAALALALAFAGSARAHDTWCLPQKFAASPGEVVRLELTSAMDFPAPESAIAAERLERAVLRLAGREEDLRPEGGGERALVLEASLHSAGVAVLGVQLHPRPISLTPDQVEEYLAEIGAPEAVHRAWKDLGAREWREVYAKHAQSFVRVGEASADRAWSEPLGLGLEIVPEADPTRLIAGGSLPVRVLRHGAPLAGLRLSSLPEGGGAEQVATTDADGRATLAFERSGRWLVRGTDLRRSQRADAEWESDFTTLTLAVGGGSL